MNITTRIQNMWYILEVRKEGYAGHLKWFRSKPTDRQVRKFVAQYKKTNKLIDINRRIKNENI